MPERKNADHEAGVDGKGCSFELDLGHLSSPGTGVVMMVTVMLRETNHGSCLVKVVVGNEVRPCRAVKAVTPDSHLRAMGVLTLGPRTVRINSGAVQVGVVGMPRLNWHSIEEPAMPD